jgi:peptidoglycan/xylan/chitin deacetylase (PgdA/CDA1 family)
MQTLQTEQATPFDSSLARHSWWRRPAWWRWAAWATVCAVVWGGYFRWRAPGPILDLKHREHLGAGSRAVSLNFDDAPHPVITPLLLASLQRSGARASFFVIGDGVTRYPELSRRILLEGHAMENHSQNHRNLSGVPREEFKREVLDAFGSIARRRS